MRRLLFIILLMPALILNSQSLNAQEFRKEITIGWAGSAFGDSDMLLPYNDRMSMSSNPLYYIFSDYDGPTYMTGNIVGEMNFHFKKWFTLSVEVAANMIWKNNYSSQTDEYIRTDRGYTFTLMPQARFNWVRKDIVRLYSSVGAGVRGGRFDERGDLLLAAQLVPVGINVGDRLFGFTELGVGTLYLGGMFGIGYRF